MTYTSDHVEAGIQVPDGYKIVQNYLTPEEFKEFQKNKRRVDDGTAPKTGDEDQ